MGMDGASTWTGETRILLAHAVPWSLKTAWGYLERPTRQSHSGRACLAPRLWPFPCLAAPQWLLAPHGPSQGWLHLVS